LNEIEKRDFGLSLHLVICDDFDFPIATISVTDKHTMDALQEKKHSFVKNNR